MKKYIFTQYDRHILFFKEYIFYVQFILQYIYIANKYQY